MFDQKHRQEWKRKRGERERERERDLDDVIRESRSGCRSVEAAWGGSDTKTALIQTDKHVCPSVRFHRAFTCFYKVRANASAMLQTQI